MKAYLIKQNGSIDNLILADIVAPEIKDNEVLIKTKAIGINPIDAFVRQNRQTLINIMKPSAEEDFQIPGWDVAGEVVRAGNRVPQWTGKSVFGMVNFPGKGKAYAEFVAAPAEQLAIKPENIRYEEAATASLAALTAWQSLVTHANIKKNDKVLIHAAAGGVGHFAVQIAKFFGAYVIGTASSANREFVLSLGADEFIDYQKEKFEDYVKDADVVLDSINREHLLRSLNTLKNEGRLVSIKGNFDDTITAEARKKQILTFRVSVRSNGADMQRIAELLKHGNIRSLVTATYTFDKLPETHNLIETGRTRGKVVVTV